MEKHTKDTAMREDTTKQRTKAESLNTQEEMRSEWRRLEKTAEQNLTCDKEAKLNIMHETRGYQHKTGSNTRTETQT